MTKEMFCEDCGEVTLHRFCPSTPESISGWECCECECGFIEIDDGYTYAPCEDGHSDADPGL